MMQFETTRFGTIEVSEEAILQFPRGLYGLEKTRAFCLIAHDETGCFRWLQSLEDPAVAMLVTDPFQFFPAYEVEIADAAAELLQVTTPAEVATYVTVTLADGGRQLQANLLGPLVINHQTGLGIQVILDAGRYSTRHVIGGRPSGDLEAAAVNPTGRTDEEETAARTSEAVPGRTRSGEFRPLTVTV